MPIRAVVFDLFHTLTGPESQWSDLPWTSDVLGIDRRVWNELLVRHSRWRLAGEETDPFTIIRKVARLVAPDIADDVVRRAVDVRIQRFRGALQRIPPENLDTLRQLRQAGLKLGLVSNADAMEMAPWSDSPLAPLFDAAIFSCAVGHVKPEPEIYHACLRALDVSAAECLFVGDGGSDELQAARTLGMTAVFVSGIMADLWPEQIPTRIAQSDHHIRTVPDVLGLVRLAGAGTPHR